MTTINSYLTFNGNCREAMTFYKECLGGELVIQTVDESPVSEQLPSQMKKCILHSMLKSDNLIIMGSDMSPQNLIKGNAVSLMLNFSSEEETRKTYASLSRYGNASQPLEIMFWGALFGHLTDKFGNQWMFNYDPNQNQNN
ncbi:PhnB protein [Flavobacterium sp. 90]|uniref:VOC family protein n=1 Tax=unclassified Flavobacterium TaxID=196869 RepID=UPI000EAE9CC5|nr:MULTISPECIES: glyoxalase/bleomycin resistance/extradiol dioxygenase family protein [unclassified Flavobacterium]RKR05412.1 PhnB protein [Flavobacterium sp. 81]TCK56727.1 PhnB protein [Flavobacterium sp. 90]